MLRLTKYLKPYWFGIVLIVLLLLGQAMAEVFLPTLMSDIVNDGIIYGVAYNVSRTDFIIRTGVLMLFVALLAGTASIIASYISPRIAAGAARDLRHDLFTKVENLSQAEFDKFSSASLITRCTNDVSQVQGLANIFARMLLYAPILAIGGIIMAFTRAPSMGWTIALSVIILIGIVSIIISIIMPKFKILQKLMDNLNRVSREILHGLLNIRAFGTQEHEKKRFDEVNFELQGLGLFIGRVLAINGPLITFMLGGTQVLVIWVGAHQVANLGLPVGDIIAFMQYATQVVIAFMMMSMVSVMIPRAQVSAVRIAEVLDTEITIRDPDSPLEFPEFNPQRGTVVFNNVSFCYPGAEINAIENISFTALPSQTLAIIGATGSGKSTIAQLLLRFYDVSDGEITVDGLDIRQVRQEDLRKKIGYVPQKGQLLSGTIASNIRYGSKKVESLPEGSVTGVSPAERRTLGQSPIITDAEVLTASTVAQAIDFINSKENKFEAEISQGGTNVSGGQRQRLSIARALAKKPEIIIFDDSFSALDFQTDAKLRKALKEHVNNATVIVIAQRVGTIINAEQILVLDEGKIVGRGTHEELLKSCEAYYEIASSQGVEVQNV